MKPNPNRSNSGNLRSALIAGVLAFVIYFVVTLLVSGYSGDALLTSLLLGGLPFVVTFIVAALIGAAVQRRKR